MRLVKIDGYTLTPDRVNGVTPEKDEQAITEQDIVKPYLEKLKIEIEKKHTKAKQTSSVLQMNAYTDCLQMIDNLLSESEVKANENEK